LKHSVVVNVISAGGIDRRVLRAGHHRASYSHRAPDCAGSTHDVALTPVGRAAWGVMFADRPAGGVRMIAPFR
jgi:hypothetical protein